MVKVENIMTRNPSCCHPEETLEKAAGIFWEHDCGCAPVTDRDNRVLGMLTDRDACIAAYMQGKPLAAIPVSSAMSRQIHTCRGSDSIAEAEQVMRVNKIRRLPVLDMNNRLVGVLSLNDIARQVPEGKPRAKGTVSPEEVAETLAAVCEPHASRQLASVP